MKCASNQYPPENMQIQVRYMSHCCSIHPHSLPLLHTQPTSIISLPSCSRCSICTPELWVWSSGWWPMAAMYWWPEHSTWAWGQAGTVPVSQLENQKQAKRTELPEVLNQAAVHTTTIYPPPTTRFAQALCGEANVIIIHPDQHTMAYWYVCCHKWLASPPPAIPTRAGSIVYGVFCHRLSMTFTYSPYFHRSPTPTPTTHHLTLCTWYLSMSWSKIE